MGASTVLVLVTSTLPDEAYELVYEAESGEGCDEGCCDESDCDGSLSKLSAPKEAYNEVGKE
jgi:hypothetical protein